MYANYHTHTVRCNHATGSEREYVENAIAGGFKILGFSDHSPYTYDGDKHYGFRMRPSDCEDYVSVINGLKEEYKDKIKIYIGYEIEYYPDKFDELLRTVEKYGYDYLIQGQHFYDSVENGTTFTATDDPVKLKTYVDRIVAGIKTGKYIYVAHPDCINFTGSDEIYKEEMKRVCIASNEYDIPLEINLLGIRGNRSYPNRRFLELEKEYGNKVILGSDAHRPCDVYSPEAIEQALGFVNEYSLNLIDEIKL